MTQPISRPLNGNGSIFERAKALENHCARLQARLALVNKLVEGFRKRVENGLPENHAMRKDIERMLNAFEAAAKAKPDGQ